MLKTTRRDALPPVAFMRVPARGRRRDKTGSSDEAHLTQIYCAHGVPAKRPAAIRV
jgi:hypothetical protein